MPLGGGPVVGLAVCLWAVARWWASQYASGRWPGGGPHSMPLGGGPVVSLTVSLWAVAWWWASQCASGQWPCSGHMYMWLNYTVIDVCEYAQHQSDIGQVY